MTAQRRSWPFAAAILCTLAVPLTGASPAAAQRFSGETTNVVAIEVPVQVIKDGEPVRGLTADNFEVFEGRKKLKVQSFEAIDLTHTDATAATAAASVPVAARRHFLFLFDLTFSEPSSIVKARASAQDLVAKSLHPTDLVAIATYSAAQGPQLVLGFSSDRQQIEKAIETLGLAKLLERSQTADPLRLVYQSELQSQSGGPANSGTRGASGAKDSVNEALIDNLKSVSQAAAQQDRQNQINRVVSLSRSLADLAKMMGNVDGRKTVVYLSEGFDSSLLTGTTDAQEIEQSHQTSETNPWATDTDALYGNTHASNRLEKMFEEFRRADCVIQAVDIGGLRGTGDLGGVRANGKEALFSMAKETGGELYENWNDLGSAMAQMLKRTSVTYVLTIQPEDLKLDGKYHQLKVELKNAPRGTRVVAKPGFYAPRPFAQQNPLERMLDAADSIVGGVESGALDSAVLAAPFRLAGAKFAYVPLLIEVDGPGLLANLQGTVVPTEIYAYALDASGAIRDFFTQNLGLDLGKVAPMLKAGGLKFFGHLELPAGDYSLRVLVRNAKTGIYGLKVLEVKVPAFDKGGPFLLPPLFPEAPGHWLMTREPARGEAKDAPYPFMSQDQPYIPSSRPVVSPGQEVPLSLVAYNLGEGEITASAKVLSADGKEVPGASLQVLGRERGGEINPDRLKATFKAPQLSPGEYQLQVSVNVAGGAPVTSSIAFVVGHGGKRG